MNSRQKIWTSRKVSKLPVMLVFALSLVSCANLCTQTAVQAHRTEATVDPADDNLKEGLKMIREHNYEGAIDSFKQAIYFSRNQYNPKAHKYLALCYKATRNYTKAIETFDQYFVQLTDHDPESRIEEAECYIELKDWKNARKTLELAGSESFGEGFNARYRYTQGMFNERIADAGGMGNGEGNYGDALQFYDSAIEEKKNYTDAWMGKARCEMKLGRTTDALRDYREILSRGLMMSPKLDDLYYNMGHCLLKHGDHQGALDHWHLALEANPEMFDAHLAIASLLDFEKHYSAAIKEYEAALRCARDGDPQIAAIKRRLIFLEQAIQPKEAPVEIKPSPSMRQQIEEQNQPPVTAPPPSKDAGF